MSFARYYAAFLASGIGLLVQSPSSASSAPQSTAILDQVREVLIEGAEGKAIHESGGGLGITHANAAGTLRASLPLINLEPGKKYSVVLDFSSVDWAYGAFCSIQAVGPAVRSSSETDPIHYAILPGLNKRFITFETGAQGGSGFLKVDLKGNSAAIHLKQIRLEPLSNTPGATPVLPPDPLSSQAEVVKLLQTEPNAQAHLATDGTRLQLTINGQPHAPLFYLSHPEPQASIHHLMTEAGIDVHVLLISLGPLQRIGKDIFPAVWIGPDKYDFSSLDARIWRALQAAPKTKLILNLGITPFPEWGDQYPDEIIQNGQGERGVGAGAHNIAYRNQIDHAAGEFWCPSLSSQQFQTDASKLLQATIAHMREQPYYKSIIGFFLAGGDDGQWQPWARSGWQNLGDFSPAGVAGFHRWLQQKYDSDPTLQAAWHNPKASLASAAVPPVADRRSASPFFDPKTEQNVIDYLAFECESKAQLVAALARVVKQAAGKAVLTGCYFQDALYGRSYSYGEAARLFSDDLDFFVSPLDYGLTRRAGWVGGEFSASPDSLRLHRKLYLCELDYRTAASRKGPEAYDHSILGRLENQQEFDSVNLRASGLMINYGMGQWYYDLATASFTPDFAQAGLRRTVELFKEMDLQTPPDPATEPQVAVFSDGFTNSYLSRAYQNDLLFPSLSMLRNSLFLSGMTCALYSMDDLMNSALPDYKVYIFPDSWYLSDVQRQFIRTKLKRSGKTLVWLHAAGYISEGGLSAQNMEDIIGMKVSMGSTAQVLNVEPSPEAPSPFDHLSHRQGVAWPTFRGLRIQVEDQTAQTLARYSDTKAVATAFKVFPDYRSVFIACPGGLGPDLLNAIVRFAGLTPTAEAGNVVVLRNSLLTLHGVAGGPVQVHLPFQAELKDLVGGSAWTGSGKDYTIPLNSGETRLFKITHAQGD